MIHSIRNPGFVGSLVSFDTDASDFFSRSGITDGGQKTAVNNFVLALKAANIWPKLHALYPFVGGTANAHRENLISSSYQISWQGTPTHNANGVTGNGTDAYGNSGYIPSTNGTANSTSLGVYNRTNGTENAPSIGAAHTSLGSQLLITVKYSDGNGYFDNTYPNSRIGVSIADPLGLFSSSRTSGSLHTAYRNSTSVGTEASAQGPLPDQQTRILASYAGFSALNISLAFIGLGLSGAEISSLYSANQAFQTALSRQV